MNKKILIKNEFLIVLNDSISDQKGLLKKANDKYLDISDFMPIDSLNNDNSIRFLLHDILDHVILNNSFMTILNETLALLVNNYRSGFYSLNNKHIYRSHKDVHISEINELFRQFLDNNSNETIHINDIRDEIKKYEKLLTKGGKRTIKNIRSDYKAYKSRYIKYAIGSLQEVLNEYKESNTDISENILNDLLLHYKTFYKISDYLAYLVNEFYYERSNYSDSRIVSEELFYTLKNIIDDNKSIFNSIEYFDKFIFTIYNDYSFKISIHMMEYSDKLDKEIIKKYCLKSDNY